MKPDELHEQWQEPAEEAVAAVAQWRAAHPKATLAEIEQAVEEQMNRLQARMIEQSTQASAPAGSEASQPLGERHTDPISLECQGSLQRPGRTVTCFAPVNLIFKKGGYS